MNVNKYKTIVKKHIKIENKKHNYLVSFLSGGIIGSTAEILYIIFNKLFYINTNNSKSYITLLVILISSFLTSIGIFDNLIRKYRCGLIIPTTGFAHSITSSAIDVKKEGLITGLGCRFFYLAGSVILYSVIASFVLILIKVILIA